MNRREQGSQSVAEDGRLCPATRRLSLSAFILLSAIASAKADRPFFNFPLLNVKEQGRRLVPPSFLTATIPPFPLSAFSISLIIPCLDGNSIYELNKSQIFFANTLPWPPSGLPWKLIRPPPGFWGGWFQGLSRSKSKRNLVARQPRGHPRYPENLVHYMNPRAEPPQEEGIRVRRGENGRMNDENVGIQVNWSQ